MNKRTIAIFGAKGQLGAELTLQASKIPHTDVVPLSHADLDITRPKDVSDFLGKTSASILVNCTAYNQVETAQKDPHAAFLLNSAAPAHIAGLCRPRSILFVHVSTDYVFDGKKGSPYSEDDEAHPVNIYGLSKLTGEDSIRILHDRHCIVRTSGLYGKYRSPSAKMNFAETILAKAKQGESLSVRNDLICTPTSAVDLAGVICQLIEQEATGTFHATNTGVSSWFDFASEILRLEHLSAPITATRGNPPDAAARPDCSLLSQDKLRGLGIQIPPWQDALARYLRERTSL